jgi:hypothetical protein
LVILALLLSGCLTRHVLVAPVRVAEVARQLQADGSAVVTDVNDERVRIEATEVDDARGKTLARLSRPCLQAPPNPYALHERGCRLARERRLVRLDRPDPWATGGLWGGALLVTVAIGTVLGVSGVLDE